MSSFDLIHITLLCRYTPAAENRHRRRREIIQLLTKRCTKACLKNHFRNLQAPIRIKFPTNWDSQLKKSLFQTRLEAAVSASAAAQKDQQNQAVVVVIVSAATAIIISAASQKDQDPENAATVSVSAPEIKQSVSIASIVASAVTSIVTSTVPFASAVCSSDITH